MGKYDKLKKIELHCHLDGSLRIETVSEWTGEQEDVVRELLVSGSKTKDLNDYLKLFELPVSLLQTKSHLKEAAFELCEDLINDNCIYAEIRFAPILHTSKNLEIDDVIDSVLKGAKRTFLKFNLILCMMRNMSLEDNKKVIDAAKKYLGKGVCAIDLAGSEGNYPTSEFKELFAYARKNHVPFTVHAGEAGSHADIDDAISFGASRIGHGIKAITNFDTMENLKKKNIPLEICFTSNVNTKAVQSYMDHPIKRLIDSGVEITINTDNRTVSDTTLSKEYAKLSKYFGFDIQDFYKANLISLDHSFLSDLEKKELKEILKENYEKTLP